METKSKNLSLKAILIIIAVGIWAIVLQNAGVIPTKQNVYVKGGYIDADVDGRVSVDNEVDINLSSINGKSNVFYDFGGNGDYVRIPVMTTYPSGR
jgi:hypothetical protein